MGNTFQTAHVELSWAKKAPAAEIDDPFNMIISEPVVCYVVVVPILFLEFGMRPIYAYERLSMELLPAQASLLNSNQPT